MIIGSVLQRRAHSRIASALLVSIGCQGQATTDASSRTDATSLAPTSLDTATAPTTPEAIPSSDASLSRVSPRARWDGSVPDGLPCEERTKRWRERFGDLEERRGMIALPTEFPLLLGAEGEPPPDWPFLHVSMKKVVIGEEIDLASPDTSIDHAVTHASANEPGVLVAPAVDADIETLIDLIAALRRAKLRVFLVVGRTTMFDYVPSGRVTKIIAGFSSERERVSVAVSNAMIAASSGCRTTTAGIATLPKIERGDPAPRLVELLSAGLNQDACSCDVDALFELGAWIVARRRSVVGKEVTLADASDARATVLQARNARELFASLPKDATGVRLVARP